MNEFDWGRTVPHSEGSGRVGASASVAALREAMQRHRSIEGWEIDHSVRRSNEMYLYGTEVESVRSGVRERVGGTVYVRNGDSMGSARVAIGPGEESLIPEKVQEAVRVAGASEFRPYPLVRPAEYPDVETRDPDIVRSPTRTLERAREELVGAIGRQSGVKLASAEFFVHDNEAIFENSKGVVVDRSGTEVVSEVVVLGQSRPGKEAENQSLRYRRRVQDLELDQWATDLGGHARDASRAETMKSWEGPVILQADSMRAFFGPVLRHTSSDSSIQGVSKFSVGDSISPEPYKGDRLVLISDPTVPFGNDSQVCDGDGLPSRPATIVENGRLKQFWADQKNAHYLSKKPTGPFANLVLPEGRQSYGQLSRGGEVLEVVRFSWLTPSRGTGDFASEIRFGYLHKNGRKIPIKGGSLNGNVFSALGDCHYSRERKFVGNALVPAKVRFNNLVVFGA